MSGPQQRIDELLADQALWGLSSAEESELAQTMQALGVQEPDSSWQWAAGAATAACLGTVQDPPPRHLGLRLEADALHYFASVGVTRLSVVAAALDDGERQAPVAVPPRRASRLPLLLAAAALVVATILGLERWQSPEPDPASRRLALLAAGDGVLQIPWTPGPSELRGDPTGDVIWSDQEQRGYMAFRGLPVNDVDKAQYQLWIFDRQRSLAQPVDGGVFDIPPGADSIVIPIDAKIAVAEGFAFAVTVENPGGVVVSDRAHIVVTAGL